MKDNAQMSRKCRDGRGGSATGVAAQLPANDVCGSRCRGVDRVTRTRGPERDPA